MAGGPVRNGRWGRVLEDDAHWRADRASFRSSGSLDGGFQSALTT